MLGAAVEIGFTLAALGNGQAPVAGLRTMPAPLWRGVSRIALRCASGIEAGLCAIVHDAARARTALPVDCDDGHPATAADRDLVILTVEVEVEDGRSLVATARRAVEIDEAEAPFRRAIAWTATDPTAATVAGLLAGILPARAGGGAATTIRSGRSG